MPLLSRRRHRPWRPAAGVGSILSTRPSLSPSTTTTTSTSPSSFYDRPTAFYRIKRANLTITFRLIQSTIIRSFLSIGSNRRWSRVLRSKAMKKIRRHSMSFRLSITWMSRPRSNRRAIISSREFISPELANFFANLFRTTLIEFVTRTKTKTVTRTSTETTTNSFFPVRLHSQSFSFPYLQVKFPVGQSVKYSI